MKRSKSIEKRQQSAIEEKSALLKNIETSEELKMSFPQFHSQRLISVNDLSISYNGRTIFSDEELEQQWNYRKTKPFVVEFLYAYSFPTPKVNLKLLYDTGVFYGEFPRGFARLSKDQFESILQLTKTNTKYVVE